MKKYVKLMSDVYLVKGTKERLLYDLGRNEFYQINESLSKLISCDFDKPLKELFSFYEDGAENELASLLNELYEMDLIFYTDNPNRFPEIEDVYHDSSTIIDNAIVEYSDRSTYDLEKVIIDLNALCCKNIQLRFLNIISQIQLKRLLKRIQKSGIKGIEIFIPFHKRLNENSLIEMISEHKRIVRINVYNADRSEIVKYSENDHFGRLRFVKSELKNGQHDVVNNHNYFISMRTFFEARHRNLGLNKKVSISDKGKIKNYVDHNKSFGTVGKDNLIDVVHREDFQRKWFIKNDDIDICKNCVYRFACINCSDIVDSPDGFKRVRYCKKETVLN